MVNAVDADAEPTGLSDLAALHRVADAADGGKVVLSEDGVVVGEERGALKAREALVGERVLRRGGVRRLTGVWWLSWCGEALCGVGRSGGVARAFPCVRRSRQRRSVRAPASSCACSRQTAQSGSGRRRDPRLHRITRA